MVFILDASGSMGADLGRETRFDAARRVVLQVLRGSGEGLEVALRVYGHRFRSNKPEANTDSELVVGFGAPDRPELEAAVMKLRCRGKTPLTYSLKESLKDLARARNPKRRVVLLTDGLESDRRAKPLQAAAALAAVLGATGVLHDEVEHLAGDAGGVRPRRRRLGSRPAHRALQGGQHGLDRVLEFVGPAA